jgi:hypothetical protein
MAQLRRPLSPDHAELEQWLDSYAVYGRCIKLGILVTPPKLPRSRRLRAALEAEAQTNTRVRAALDAAKAGKPSKHRRVFADAELRIY